MEVQEGYHYFTSGADISEKDCINEVDAEGNEYVEMLFPADTAKLILDEEPPPGFCARMRCYVAHGKKAVVDRDTDLLTADEYRENRKAVAASVLEELKIWITRKCFTRRWRKGAYNILDVKWVGKWKWVKVKDLADPERKVRIIRAG